MKKTQERDAFIKILRQSPSKKDGMVEAVTNHGKLTSVYFRSWARDSLAVVNEYGIGDTELVSLLLRIADELEKPR